MGADWAPSHADRTRPDRSGMRFRVGAPFEHFDGGAAFTVPDVDGPHKAIRVDEIARTRRDAPAVRRPCQRVQFAVLAGQSAFFVPWSRVPDRDLFSPPGCESLAVGTPGERLIWTPDKREELVSALGVQNLCN